MPEWTIQVDEETDRIVRAHLARAGLTDGDLSRFVGDASREAALLARERDDATSDPRAEADLTPRMGSAITDETFEWARRRPD